MKFFSFGSYIAHVSVRSTNGKSSGYSEIRNKGDYLIKMLWDSA